MRRCLDAETRHYLRTTIWFGVVVVGGMFASCDSDESIDGSPDPNDFPKRHLDTRPGEGSGDNNAQLQGRLRSYLNYGTGDPSSAAEDYLGCSSKLDDRSLIAEAYQNSPERCLLLIGQLAKMPEPIPRTLAVSALASVPDAEAQIKAIKEILPPDMQGGAYSSVIGSIAGRNPEELWEHLDDFPLGKHKTRAAKTYVTYALRDSAEVVRVVDRLAQLDSPDISRDCIATAAFRIGDLVNEGKLEKSDVVGLIRSSSLTDGEKVMFNRTFDAIMP